MKIRSGFPVVAALLAAVIGCDDPEPADNSIPIGLLLSYTGLLAGNSANSERAVAMAIEAANAAGGVEERPFRLVSRDTLSDPSKVAAPTRELLDAGAVIIIGPDAGDFLTQLRDILMNRTMLLPSYATASDVEYKPADWFVMGPGVVRIACELVSQSRVDGRRQIMQIVSAGSYNGSLSFALSNAYNLPRHILSRSSSSATGVRQLTREMLNADAYLLAAPPDLAVSLIYALSAIGELQEPTRWYLSPTLHTPAFLEAIPRGSLDGARGISTGTVAGGGDFRTLYNARWEDAPLDDAYAFYDAAALATLSIQRAMRGGRPLPTGNDLTSELVNVTRAGGIPVHWNELGEGLRLLREGQEIEYYGLTGQLQFDNVGKPRTTTTKWWTIEGQRFVDLPQAGGCL